LKATSYKHVSYCVRRDGFKANCVKLIRAVTSNVHSAPYPEQRASFTSTCIWASRGDYSGIKRGPLKAQIFLPRFTPPPLQLKAPVSAKWLYHEALAKGGGDLGDDEEGRT
jgi:hypothetical protein